jgi:hypothetical protein
LRTQTRHVPTRTGSLRRPPCPVCRASCGAILTIIFPSSAPIAAAHRFKSLV